MKLLRRTQPKTPLTHTDEFTAEEIAAFFCEEYGVDLSGETEKVILGYTDIAKRGGREAVLRAHKSAESIAEYIHRRSPAMVEHDSFAVKEHQMNMQMEATDLLTE